MLFCGLAFASLARAQETTNAPQNTDAATAQPKKANARPLTTALAPEPFDGASVEKMAALCVRLETASGVIEAEMLAESAPETVRNFLNLVATRAFDSTTFSRVVKDFVVQGGNLATRESLTPELVRRATRTLPDEPNNIKHTRGILSMARTEAANSATTSFFILTNDAPHLDGTFAAFGRVVRGMDVVDAINHAPVEGEKPVKPVRLLRALVTPCANTLKLP